MFFIITSLSIYPLHVVMLEFVIIALICNTCPNLPNLKYILPQFVIAALFCNNGRPNL